MIFRTLKRSPALIVFLIGVLVLGILLLRGLDIGPLHTDIIIQRAWFKQVGMAGFPQRMFESNQRHLLYGPWYALMYGLFGEQDLPFHFVYQASRVLEGVFMAGLIYQLTRRRDLAICAGVALMLTVIRVRELYQEVNWFIEPTLAVLLASSYFYVLSLRQPRLWRLYYPLSIFLYLAAILEYEASLPWIGVNLVLGWLIRTEEPIRVRAWLAVRDALPGMFGGALYLFVVLYGFKLPFSGEASASGGNGLIPRVLRELARIVTFPGTLADAFRVNANNGYGPLIVGASLLAVANVVALGTLNTLRNPHPSEQNPEAQRGHLPHLYPSLLGLAVVMVLAASLIGASQLMGDEILDRVTFGRAAGIALFYVALIFGVGSQLRTRWKNTIAAGFVALVLIGPGVAWLWIYQDYAHASRAEINRMAAAVLELQKVIYNPTLLVIVTDPDWVVSRMNDASDVLVHEIQQKVWESNGFVTIDILKTGAYLETYDNIPGTCDNIDGVASAGVCLGTDGVHPTRWGVQAVHPYTDVVVASYNATLGKLTILPAITIAALQGYNFTTAGPTTLNTNPERVAIPVPGLNTGTR